MGWLTGLKEKIGVWPEGGADKNYQGNSWRKSEQRISWKILLLGILGLALFWGPSWFGQRDAEGLLQPIEPDASSKFSVNTISQEELTALQRYQNTLSIQLQEILSEVKGAGEVSVYVNLGSGPEYDFAHNLTTESRHTEEQDATGGQRVVNEVREDSQLVMTTGTQSGLNQPLIQKEMHPAVQGVLVVAAGAENSRVKAELTRAIQVILGIGSHQVVVLPRER
ncbi:MAG: hypothetical protein ACOX3A_01390 [bacterium]|jgi:stage III sporulation protein AG